MQPKSESLLRDLATQRSRTFYLGLTNTLDRILELNDGDLSDLAQEFSIAKRELYLHDPDEIHSVRELLLLFLGLIYRGSGGESSFRTDEICSFLNERFHFTEALGGTGVRASAVVEEAGFFPTVHLTATTGRAACLAAGRPFNAISSPDVQRQFPDEEASAGCGSDCPHYIFQYHEGFRVQLLEEEIVARRDNRLIFTNDPVNNIFPINPDFLRQYAEDSGPATLLISGFNGIKNLGRLQERLALVQRNLVLRRSRNKASILELGAYKSLEFLKEVLETLGQMVDYVSMNEEELVQLEYHGLGGERPKSPDELIAKAASVANTHKLGNLIVHGAPMSLCLSKGTHSPNHLRACLKAANAIAATKASGSDFSKFSDRIRAGLHYPVSPVGEASCRLIDGKRFDDYVVVAEPARIVDGKLETIGLGDSFIGAFVLFLR